MKTIRTILFLLTLYNLLHAQEYLKPAITPYWGFGHWIWEDQIHTSNTVKYMLDGYSKYNIPVSAVILDSPWSLAYNDYRPDTTLYSDFESFISELKERNTKIILWYTGFVNKESREVPINECPTFEYAVKNNFIVNNGKLTKWHKGKGVHIDFTNVDAVNWWHTQVDNVLKMGIDGWKVDISAAWLEDSILTSIGYLSNEEFRPYYYKDAFEYAKSNNPDFFCYTYGYVYLKAYQLDTEFNMAPINYSHGQWSGDFEGDFEGITKQLEFIYKTANKGYGSPACEIGGYWGKPSEKKSFIRYTQLGSMVPLMVNGGNKGAVAHHLPWNYDNQTIKIYKDYVQLHQYFAPYLFSQSVDGHLNGHSIIQSPSFENKSHLLGEDIFVKTITSENDSVKILFPSKNLWINYWDINEVYSSSDSISKYYPIEKYPIFIKAGAIIPVNSTANKKVELKIFPYGKSKMIFHKPVGQGIKYTDISVSIDEEKGVLEITSNEKHEYEIKIICFSEPKSVEGVDNFSYDVTKSELLLEKRGNDFKIKLKELNGYLKK